MDDDRRLSYLRLIGRPLFFIFWSLVVWGTYYGLFLLWHTATKGPGALSWARAGGDHTNPALALFAAVVWVLVAAVWAARRVGEPPVAESSRQSTTGSGSSSVLRGRTTEQASEEEIR